MGERLINPLFNVHDRYRRMIINPYRFATGGGGGGLTLVEIGSDISPDPTYNLNGTTHELTSGGSWYAGENFGFAYEEFSIGTKTLIAQISSFSTAAERPIMGIHLSNEATTPRLGATIHIRYLGGNHYMESFGRRRTNLGWAQFGTAQTNLGATMTGVCDWLKLELSGNTISCFYSGNGSSWTSFGSNTLLDLAGGDNWDLGGVMRAGIIVSAGNTQVDFDNYSLT